LKCWAKLSRLHRVRGRPRRIGRAQHDPSRPSAAAQRRVAGGAEGIGAAATRPGSRRRLRRQVPACRAATVRPVVRAER
jgi:hypothetical protein